MRPPDVIRYNVERLHNDRLGEEPSMHAFTRITLAGVVITAIAGRIYCPLVERVELKPGLAIPFSMWQCAVHGDAADPGFVH